jgi:sugar phosphate isomerase/epimerase
MTTAIPRPIALQMYTFRDLGMSFPDTLALAAEIGFVGVEPAGLHATPPSEVRQILDDLGLQACSAHVPLPDNDEGKAALEEMSLVGAPVVCSSLHKEWFATEDQVARAADRFAVAASAAGAAGLELGYHNHWWEFSQHLAGRPAYHVFLDALRDRGVPVLLEVDLYWVQVGGVDPAQLVGELGDAVRYLHVKDGPGTQEASMTALGTGIVDLPAVLGANDAVQWHIVELDRCATDMVEAVRQSYQYLVGGHYSTGRSQPDSTTQRATD